MMSTSRRNRRISILLSQLREITEELDRLNLTLDHEDVEEEDLEVARFVGRTVKVVNGTYKGKRGVVTGRRGAKFWWINLENGDRVYKMAHNFRVVRERED